MKSQLFYKPIATINDPEIIIDLFPNTVADIDPSLAKRIVEYCEFYPDDTNKIIDPEPETYLYIGDIIIDNSTVITPSLNHAVRFTRGDISLLKKYDVMHGFYIDIYELVPDDEIPVQLLYEYNLNDINLVKEIAPEMENGIETIYVVKVESDSDDYIMAFRSEFDALNELNRVFLENILYIQESGFEDKRLDIRKQEDSYHIEVLDEGIYFDAHIFKSGLA